jgi:hypothetical protein
VAASDHLPSQSGKRILGNCARRGQKSSTVFMREKEQQLYSTKPSYPSSEFSSPDEQCVATPKLMSGEWHEFKYWVSVGTFQKGSPTLSNYKTQGWLVVKHPNPLLICSAQST